MNIARQHLALLGVLDTLLDERSVTRAAERLHLSQPAVSNALARLRELLNDPLLVRQGREMVLTPKAQDIGASVREIVASATALLESSASFEPHKASRQFTIAASDAVNYRVIPDLVTRLASSAPEVTLRVISSPTEIPTESLGNGTIDLLAGHHAHIPEHLHVTKLFEQPLVVVTRKQHPTIKSHVTLGQFLTAQHVVIFPHAADMDVEMQRVFAKHKKEFRLFASVQQASTAARIVARTDAIALFPWLMAKTSAAAMGLQVLQLPKELRLPRAAVYQVWHERMHNDPGHRWLRETVSETANALALNDS